MHENVLSASEASKISLKSNSMPDLLTQLEVARFFRVSNLTVKRWAVSKQIPAIIINKRGDRRYRKEDILAIYKNGFSLKNE